MASFVVCMLPQIDMHARPLPQAVTSAPLSHPPHSGPPITPGIPLNIMPDAAAGQTVHADSLTSFAYQASGDGSSYAEQFYAYNSLNLANTAPIQPWQTTILKSRQTGQYCHLAPLPASPSLQGVVCDQATAATATVLTYTGTGLKYNNVALAPTGPGSALVLDASAIAAAAALDILPAPAASGKATHSLLRHTCKRKCRSRQLRPAVSAPMPGLRSGPLLVSGWLYYIHPMKLQLP